MNQIISGFHNPEESAFWKHCGEKEKMPVTSLFSFSHNVFYPSRSKSQSSFACGSYCYAKEDGGLFSRGLK